MYYKMLLNGTYVRPEYASPIDQLIERSIPKTKNKYTCILHVYEKQNRLYNVIQFVYSLYIPETARSFVKCVHLFIIKGGLLH